MYLSGDPTPTPIPTFPLKGKEPSSLPFKGRVRVGMGLSATNIKSRLTTY